MTNATRTIFAALAAAQASFSTVVKNKVNPAFHSKYADLQAILSAVMPSLTAHGLFLTQKIETGAGTVKVETIIYHESGESISSGVLEMSYAGGKNPPQAMGSALTYARRYSLSTFLGVAADDDDDGNGAGEAEKKVFVLTEPMVQAAQAAAAKGVESYRAYYQSRPEPERVELSKSGWHQNCYSIAKKADDAKAAPAQEAA